MRILVTFAVEAEFAPWRKLRKFDLMRLGPRGASEFTQLWETLIGDTCVSVYLTGIVHGLPREPMEMREIFLTAKPDLASSSRPAGALKQGLKPGDLSGPQQLQTLRNEASADSYR